MGFYFAEFVILILLTLINVYIPSSMSWAQKLFIQLMAAGAIVAAKYGLMAIPIISLSLALYFDMMDSEGLVG